MRARELFQPLKPHDWIQGLKRIPLHSLFAGVGIGARFIPPPYNFVILGAFAVWRGIAEWKDYKGQRDTAGKSWVDFISQVGSAAAGAFIPW